MASWSSRPSRCDRAKFAGLVALACALSCTEAQEARHVELVVLVDGSCTLSTLTNLGYTVQLQEAQLAMSDLQFSVAGEVHAAARPNSRAPLRTLLLPRVHAHPGHYTGGEVTGELLGRFVVDWIGDPGVELGRATLLEGHYDSANMTLERAQPSEVSAASPLIGHSAWLRGTATKDGAEVSFVALVDAPPGRQIVGFPFDLRVHAHTDARLGLQLCTVDPLEQDTLFDDIEFATLTPASSGSFNGQVVLEEASQAPNLAAYQRLKRALLSHDHFVVRPL
jgi:hypothetical protein